MKRGPRFVPTLNENDEPMRKCGLCDEWKPVETGFHANRRDPIYGRHHTCKPCHSNRSSGWVAKRLSEGDRTAHTRNKEWLAANPSKAREYHRTRLLRTYGLTPEAYNQLLESQDDRCAICQGAPTQKMHVDHDHETGEVRGILCLHCNVALGNLKESVELIDRARAYLTGELRREAEAA